MFADELGPAARYVASHSWRPSYLDTLAHKSVGINESFTVDTDTKEYRGLARNLKKKYFAGPIKKRIGRPKQPKCFAQKRPEPDHPEPFKNSWDHYVALGEMLMAAQESLRYR